MSTVLAFFRAPLLKLVIEDNNWDLSWDTDGALIAGGGGGGGGASAGGGGGGGGAGRPGAGLTFKDEFDGKDANDVTGVGVGGGDSKPE